MKKLIIISILSCLVISMSAQEFIGERLFRSSDKQDSMRIRYRNDSIIFWSNRPINFEKYTPVDSTVYAKKWWVYKVVKDSASKVLPGYGIIIRNDSLIVDSTKLITIFAAKQLVADTAAVLRGEINTKLSKADTIPAYSTFEQKFQKGDVKAGYGILLQGDSTDRLVGAEDLTIEFDSTKVAVTRLDTFVSGAGAAGRVALWKSNGSQTGNPFFTADTAARKVKIIADNLGPSIGYINSGLFLENRTLSNASIQRQASPPLMFSSTIYDTDDNVSRSLFFRIVHNYSFPGASPIGGLKFQSSYDSINWNDRMFISQLFGNSAGSLSVNGNITSTNQFIGQGITTNSVVGSSFAGPIQLLNTQPLRFGGTNNTNYTHNIASDNTALIIKPLVDNINSIVFENSNSTKKPLIINTLTGQIFKGNSSVQDSVYPTLGFIKNNLQVSASNGVYKDGDTIKLPDMNNYTSYLADSSKGIALSLNDENNTGILIYNSSGGVLTFNGGEADMELSKGYFTVNINDTSTLTYDNDKFEITSGDTKSFTIDFTNNFIEYVDATFELSAWDEGFSYLNNYGGELTLYSGLINTGFFIELNDTVLISAKPGGGVNYVQLYGSLTDNSPTSFEIEAICGDAMLKGAGYQVTIKDTDGTGLLYKVESDGTDWYYTVMTKAN